MLETGAGLVAPALEGLFPPAVVGLLRENRKMAMSMTVTARVVVASMRSERAMAYLHDLRYRIRVLRRPNWTDVGATGGKSAKQRRERGGMAVGVTIAVQKA